MPRVTHFEIHAQDAEKTKQFYEKVFGWVFNKWEGPMNYWMISTGEGPGIDGGMALKNEAQFQCNTIDVDDMEKYIDLVKGNGGEILVPPMNVPGVGSLAYFKDPDGSIWGLMKNDPPEQG
jgi:hypothetical protein